VDRARLITVTETLISAGVGLVIGLVPFGYKVWTDREAQRKRERAEKERDIEQERERRRSVATLYLERLARTMALLEAIHVDADNADELLNGASLAYADLTGLGQGELLMTFGESSPVVWADRACRRLLDKGLAVTREARSQRQTGQEAWDTSMEVKYLTGTEVDEAGPRDLIRWATSEAVRRWPEELTTFETQSETAQRVAGLADLQIRSELVAVPSPQVIAN
jgi:hypothetical protein